MIEQLLNEHQLNPEKISNLLSDLFVKDVDYADLYFQHSVAESWSLEEGIVKSGTYHISHGVGTRAVKGEQTGFSYSDDLNISNHNFSIIGSSHEPVILYSNTAAPLTIAPIISPSNNASSTNHTPKPTSPPPVR
jgi:TldD protein